MNEAILQQKKSLEFWFNKVKEPIEPAQIGIYRHEKKSTIVHTFDLSEKAGGLVNERSNKQALAQFVLLQAPLFLMFSKLSQSTLVRSIAPSLKPEADSNGFLISQVSVNGNDTVKSLLHYLQQEIKAGWNYQGVLPEHLADKLEANGQSITESFHFGFAFEQEFDGDSNASFNVSIKQRNQTYQVSLKAFSPKHNLFVLKEFGKSYEALLHQMLLNSEEKLGDLSLLSEEQNQAIAKVNDTEKALPFVPLIEHFLRNARCTPQKVAFYDEKLSLSFEQAVHQVNRLACLFTKADIQKGDVVAVCGPRSVLQPLTLLACQVVGAIYLPVDVNNPSERSAFILTDAAAKVLVTADAMNLEVAVSQIVFDPSSTEETIIQNKVDIRPKDPCYIIYTSGSTGKPKGVILKHDALANYIHTIEDQHKTWFEDDDQCLSMANPAFDVALYEYALPITTGCSLYVLEESSAVDPLKVAHCLAEKQISFCYLPPIYLHDIGQQIEANPEKFALRKLHVGLEAILDERLKTFTDALPELEILNGYGPSEITVGSNYFFFDGKSARKRVVPIGPPILNTRMFVLDQHGQALPFGFSGELHIGGIGLAIGYLNREELTNEKFKIHPNVHPEKLYASGDHVVMDEGGNVHFLGRIDSQLKIRGYRVEPGEIEKVLLQHEGILEVLVIGVPIDGQKELCAYLVSDQKVEIAELSSLILEKLPAYMLPVSWNFIPSIPLTANGKPDRKHLPEPKLAVKSTNRVLPESPTQIKIHEAFEQILKTEIGIHDSFFDFGGNSLKAAKLVAYLFESYQFNVPFRAVFQSATVAQLADQISPVAAGSVHKIESAPEQEYYPLSHAQKRMYMTQAVDEQGTVYNMPGAFFLIGKVDFQKLENTFSELIQRHEGLRTQFVQHEGETVQRILKRGTFQLEWLQRNGESEEEVLKRFISPFDLSSGNLLRVGAVEWEKDFHLILIDMHHIVSDGVSASQFLMEFNQFYQGEQLKEQVFHYKDFAYWLANLPQASITDQKEFWMKQLEGLQPLELPFDRVPTELDHAQGANTAFNVPPQLSSEIFNKSKELNTTPYVLLLSAFQLLLSKWTNTKNVSVGTVYAGRIHPNLETVLGMFVNTLPHRVDVSAFEKLADLIENNGNLRLDIHENQCFPTEELANELSIEVPRHKHPYFQTLFVYQNIKFEVVDLDGLKMQPIESSERVAKFDLTLEVVETDGNLQLHFNYPKVAFEDSTIERLGNRMIHLLEVFVGNTQLRIEDVHFISENEQAKIEQFSFGPALEPSPYASILHAFAEQVSINGDRVCVQDENETFTYAEVDKRSSKIASLLFEKGIQREDCIGVLLPRCADYLIANLGILKAGGAFVPFDINHPSGRIQNLIEDAEIKILLTNEEQLTTRVEDNLPLLWIDEAPSEIRKWELPKDSQLAYVLYTSGSTGKPKGVEIEHGSLMHTLWAEKEILKLDLNTVMLQQTNPVFDVALLEFFLPLLVGGKLAVPNHDKVLDFNYLIPFIAKQKVTNFQGTPSLYRSILESGVSIDPDHDLKVICVGGESLDENLFEQMRNYFGVQTQIDNHYGPTEAAIDVISNQNIQSFQQNSIGRPYPNTEIRILDWQNKVCGIGTPGELCISSIGLARGYRKDQQKTDKAFQVHSHLGDRRFYHTGDLAMWMEDGQIRFLGRKDDQIKIRGQRVELGEISSVLRQLKDVKNAQVLLHEEGQDKQLLAYVMSEKPKDWRVALLNILPEAIVPWHYIEVNDWPMTPNGKTDNKVLRKLGEAFLQNKKGNTAPPETELQERILTIWEDLLGHENIGIRDNFFEIGGHSLKATQVIARVHHDLQLELKLADLFQHPTIESIAKVLEKGGAVETQNIDLVEPAEFYPLSHAQRRLFVLHQFQEQQAAYNLPAAFKLIGSLDKAALTFAYQSLVDRHESLRTSFLVVDQQPVQMVHESLEVEVNFQKVIGLEEQGLVARAADDAILPFDLAKAPLVRLTVLEYKTSEFLCLFNMHHIISDGWSINILIDELLQFYHAKLQNTEVQISPLRIQYKDFSAWQNQLLESERGQEMANYWKDQFAGEIPVLNLPSDRPRPAIKTNVGTAISYEFNPELSEKIQKYCQQKGVSPFMFVLGLTKVLLRKQSGQNDLVFGTPIAGREHLDAENLVGCFVNTLALRSQIAPKTSFDDFLETLKENTLEAFANQQYPFDRLVDEVVTDRDTSRSPLFDVMLIMENYDETEAQFSDLRMEGVDVERKVSKFDLSFYFKEKPEGLFVLLEYNTDLYDEWRMNSMLQQMEKLADSILKQPSTSIEHLSYLPSQDVDKIQKFNRTEKAFQPYSSLVEWMEQTCANHPNNSALHFEDKSYSHAEVHELSDQVAAGLHKRFNTKPNDIIALSVERSEWLPIAILGILKSGAAYLPIDPKTPDSRLDFILKDSGAKAFIADQKRCGSVDLSELLDVEAEMPEISISPNDLAYVIYTSGSTGNPKGVMIEHSAILNRLQWMQSTYPIGSTDIVLQKTNFTFDVSVWELLLWSVAGAQLRLLKPDGEKDPVQIIKAIEKGVSVIHFVPSMLSVWLEYLESIDCLPDFSSLRIVYASGEALSTKHVQRFTQLFGNSVQLINKYGPTEAAIDVTHFNCENSNGYSSIPIGEPIANTRLYVLNEELLEQPIGVPGELCIAGSGLARGYLNRPDLTTEKFVGAPHLQEEKIYKTGDLVSWLPDGQLTYHGRMDFQVKIRGFRIELGEIAQCMLALNGLEEALVVSAKDDNGQDQLIGYFTTKQATTLEVVQTHLQTKLPSYMVPAHLMKLDKIPTTSNGKVDRKKLPKPNESVVKQVSQSAPKDGIEQSLAEIWSNLLGVNKIYRESNFFHLGGDSIKAIQLSARILKLGLSAEIGQLFQNPTLEKLALVLTNQVVDISQEPFSGDLILSPIQQRFFEKSFQNVNYYNQAVMIQLPNDVVESKLREATELLCQQHDALRATFSQKDGEWRQSIIAIEDFASPAIVDYRDQVFSETMLNQAQASLNMKEGKLMHLSIVQIDEQNYLHWVAHHLIIDSVSWRILVEDLGTMYQQLCEKHTVQLPIRTHGVDQWLTTWKKIVQSDKEAWKDFWLKLNEVDNLNVSKLKGQSANATRISLNVGQTDRLLKDFASKGFNVNDVLLSALSASIEKWNGQKSTKIMLEGHGRTGTSQLNLTQTVGWLTSIYPYALIHLSEWNLEDLLKAHKSQRESLPHEGVSYGFWVQDEGLAFEEPQVEFNYLGYLDESNRAGADFSIAPMDAGQSVDPKNQDSILLSITAGVSQQQLHIQFESREGVDTDSIKVLTIIFQEKLEELIDSADTLESDNSDHEEVLLAIDQPFQVLSEGSKHLFLMPPALGAYFAFRELADELTGYSIHAANYIVDEDKLEQYARYVESVQPTGEILLGGYSGGANLAFELAVLLLKQGRIVSKLLFIDGKCTREVETYTDDLLDQQVVSLIGNPDEKPVHPMLANVSIREVVSAKIRSYDAYLYQTAHSVRLNQTTIYQISSKESRENGIADDGWSDLCAQFEVLNGNGMHREMLVDDNLKLNAELMRKALKEEISKPSNLINFEQ